MTNRRSRLIALATAAVALLAVFAISTAALTITAANEIEPGVITDSTLLTSPNDLKPDECAAIDVVELVNGGVNITGPDASALVLASSETETITGGNQDDCIVGKDGVADIDGGDGSDVCIGGSATVFANCETEIRL